MPTEQLTYAQIAERLGVSAEAARAIVKRHRLPRSRSNDGKTLAAIDLEETRHKPLPARSPRGHRSVTDVVATLKARVAELEAELARAEERSRDPVVAGDVTHAPGRGRAAAPTTATKSWPAPSAGPTFGRRAFEIESVAHAVPPFPALLRDVPTTCRGPRRAGGLVRASRRELTRKIYGRQERLPPRYARGANHIPNAGAHYSARMTSAHMYRARR
jgi:hypothetical protein